MYDETDGLGQREQIDLQHLLLLDNQGHEVPVYDSQGFRVPQYVPHSWASYRALLDLA